MTPSSSSENREAPEEKKTSAAEEKGKLRGGEKPVAERGAAATAWGSARRDSLGFRNPWHRRQEGIEEGRGVEWPRMTSPAGQPSCLHRRHRRYRLRRRDPPRWPEAQPAPPPLPLPRRCTRRADRCRRFRTPCLPSAEPSRLRSDLNVREIPGLREPNCDCASERPTDRRSIWSRIEKGRVGSGRVDLNTKIQFTNSKSIRFLSGNYGPGFILYTYYSNKTSPKKHIFTLNQSNLLINMKL